MPPLPHRKPKFLVENGLRIQIQQRTEQQQQPDAPQAKTLMPRINSFDQQQIVQQVEPDYQKKYPEQPIADGLPSPVRKQKGTREQQLKDDDHKQDIRQAKAHDSKIRSFL